MFALDFTLEVRFAMVLRPVDGSFLYCFCSLLLLEVWVLKVIHNRLRWLLRMLIVIRLFVQGIETGLGLPFGFTCLFLLYFDFILVH